MTDNAIETLPDELGQCTQLQKLMLAGNCLSSLPASLANCHSLELVRIAANRFTALPDCLLSLPRLSWLAYAGNPCCEARELAALAEAGMPGVAWQRLQLAQQLGEGASGVIRLNEQSVQIVVGTKAELIAAKMQELAKA